MTLILGIETSCDETAAAVVADGVDVYSNVVASQVDFHRKFGGVVPEIASRAHIERLDTVIDESLERAGCTIDDIDAFAVTNRPGLVGALLVGVTAAKTLSWRYDKPLIAVDHIQAHAYSAAIGRKTSPWPAIGLIASGGHTSLYRIHDANTIDRIGATVDDAAGEAFDKVASILALPYPGGPEIETLASRGNPKVVDFPRTLFDKTSLDFSFSGIKTAVLYHVHGHGKTSGGLEKWSQQELADIAASFQQAVIDMLITKTLRAAKQNPAIKTVVLGGGVAANKTLRAALDQACRHAGLAFQAAEWQFCTDNAGMVAGLGYHLLQRGELAGLDLDAQPTSR